MNDESEELFVRAKYDYKAAEQSALSFHAGDIIRVVDQLESGWWDGLLNGQRGWFPSNYTALLDLEDPPDYVDEVSVQGKSPRIFNKEEQHLASSAQSDNRVPYWIPQASANGVVYFYNPDSGETRKDLPMDPPVSLNDQGPQDWNFKPPPGPDDEGEIIFVGLSPATVLPTNAKSTHNSLVSVTSSPHSGKSSPRPTVGICAQPGSQTTFFDNYNLTWDSLFGTLSVSVARLRDAVDREEKSMYPLCCVEICEQVRLLLQATTDGPSIRQTRAKSRAIVAALSKLLLSSNVASSEWRAADAEEKYLQNAEKLLQIVETFIDDVRAEPIIRVLPGFIKGGNTGGGWGTNGIDLVGHQPSAFEKTNGEKVLIPPNGDLSGILEKLETEITVAVKALPDMDDDNLICKKCEGILPVYKNFSQLVESIDLSSLSSAPLSPTLIDFAAAKQRLYDSLGDLVMACQALTLPAGSESHSSRLADLRASGSSLEKSLKSVVFNTGLLVEDALTRPSSTNSSLRKLSIVSTSSGNLKESVAPSPASISPSISSETLNFSSNSPNRKEAKVRRFFGTDSVPYSPSRDETPWYLGLEHESQLVLDNKGNVKAGTLIALTERLTRHDLFDSAFSNTFLLTYRSFTSAEELFDLLVQRFTIQPPEGLCTAEFDIWTERKQRPIRLRVFNILKSWIESYWVEPETTSGELLDRIRGFSKQIMALSFRGADVLERLIEKRQKGQDVGLKRATGGAMLSTPPPPILPKNPKVFGKIKFLDIDALEFARQLTLTESQLYVKIKPTDCMSKAWSNKDPKKRKGENIKAMILNSNQMTGWVTHSILSPQEPRKRVSYIKHWLAIAEKCRQLGNFSSVVAIMAGLNSAPVYRLKRTWEQAPSRTHTILEALNQMINSSKNFAVYRELLHLVDPPCVPFLGVSLTDLTFIEDGNANMLKDSTDMINFSKRAKTAEVIREIQQYQSVPYSLETVPELQKFIIQSLTEVRTVDPYERSLDVEPREREDEKIARLLAESGFL